MTTLREVPTSLIDDDVLPAAAHLTGPGATAILRAAVDAAGGELVSAGPCHVQYRPASDVVVRYRATVSWRGARPVADTLLAAATSAGPPPGTLPVVADTGDRRLEVGVWRWPFDPALPALGDAVTPDRAARLLAGVVRGPVRLEVVAYRPTERAVVRVIDADGAERYVKLVPPAQVPGLVDRHERLRAAGLPVPTVLAADATAGWLAMAALRGDTLRTRLKDGHGPLPRAAELRRITAALGAATLPGVPAVRPRTSSALGHAAMLAAVAEDQVPRLERLAERLTAAAERAEARRGPVVHGDLHEAQLVLDGERIVGVLDVDDAGPGDPLDDLATVLGHLRYRATTARRAADRQRIGTYADALRRAFVADVDATELDTVTGAVLVGLATGPFRVQQRGWARDVRRLLDLAEHLVGR